MPKTMVAGLSKPQLNGIVYLISVFGSLLLIYKQAVDFVYIESISCIFALGAQSFVAVDSSLNTIISPINKTSLFSIYMCVCVYNFLFHFFDLMMLAKNLVHY